MTVEQAQQAAFASNIPEFIVMGVVMLVLGGWVIWCVVMFLRAYRRAASQIAGPAHVRCERCGAMYDLSAAEVLRLGLIRSVSVTRPRQVGVARVEEPEYRSFSKKFDCPVCHQRAYGQVMNIGELQGASRPALISAGVRWLATMVIGGALLFAIGSIPINMMRASAKQAMQEELQQSFNERYGLDD